LLQNGETLLTRVIDTAMWRFGKDGFSPSIVKLIRGSLEERDSAGSTPLLRWTYSRSPLECGLQLLEYGADINAQDSKGNSMLHLLCENLKLYEVRELGKKGWLAGCDFALENQAGETVLQAAQLKQLTLHVRRITSAPTADALVMFVQAQEEVWQQHVRPAMHSAVAEQILLEVAELAMQYVDGSNEFKDGSGNQ
jgi:hypothetical protein